MIRHSMRLGILALLLGSLCGGQGLAQMDATGPARDVFSDTWVATDALGRELAPEAGYPLPRTNKQLGLFYWTWHYWVTNGHEPVNNSKVMAEHPDALQQPDLPAWGSHSAPHWWNEPLFGFYDDRDPWVLRKHAQMLADAGVDAIFFDTTNGEFTWQEAYMALLEEFEKARKDGIRTPKIVFMCAFGPVNQIVDKIYRELYEPGLYKDLWYMWDGKPLIMAYPDNVPEPARSFFTFRPGQPLYNAGPKRPDHWGWLEIFPQHGFVEKPGGGFEQVTVGVAQNYSLEHNGGSTSAFTWPGSFGRSYHNGAQDPRPDAYGLGLNFAEQWTHALKMDPDLIFITGWNEWVAGLFPKSDPNWGYWEVNFVDQFDNERSRDIEPSKGPIGDNYYYQMIDGIRRFKGARTVPGASPALTVAVDGQADEWARVGPEFRHHHGSTPHRDFRGSGPTLHYRDTSGRNDLVLTKVARDRQSLYFMAQTADALTSSGGEGWMWLLLDTDRSRETGWEGYDWRVRPAADGQSASLERNSGGWNWEAAATVPCAFGGDLLELAVPLNALGLDATRALELEFKWLDHAQQPGQIMDVYVSGETAPSGRFNYLYTTRNPFVDAGPDTTVKLGLSGADRIVRLRGALLSNEGDAEALTQSLHWFQKGGPSVTLTGAETLTPEAQIDAPGTYLFGLRAGTERVYEDDVTVTVSP